MHNASKVLMGSSLSSAKEISTFDADPATYKAGLCVSLASNSGLSLLKSAGMRVGVSLGKSLSDSKKTAVLRTGESVPVLASLKRATGVITVSDYTHLLSGGGPDTLEVAGVTFTAQAGAATPGDDTFQAATGNNETAASIAAQINAHATASAKVYAVASGAAVTLYSVVDGVGSTGTGNDIALVYNNLHDGAGIVLSGLSSGKLSGGSDTISDIAYISKGAKMYINDVTGKADINISGFCTISDAVYVSEKLTGVDESASEVAAVLVDMPGGL